MSDDRKGLSNDTKYALALLDGIEKQAQSREVPLSEQEQQIKVSAVVNRVSNPTTAYDLNGATVSRFREGYYCTSCGEAYDDYDEPPVSGELFDVTYNVIAHNPNDGDQFLANTDVIQSVGFRWVCNTDCFIDEEEWFSYEMYVISCDECGYEVSFADCENLNRNARVDTEDYLSGYVEYTEVDAARADMLDHFKYSCDN